ncbi:hypothetical protein [Cerasicoccus frondis]|uniref:hypothetical protein n=1 Tax=Cerasicoccus frondis TaxID=490090 RepID=UPI002852B17B|nr:hypothetical protein [Cerasicoccus frondis]
MNKKVTIGGIRFQMTSQQLRDSWWLNCDGVTFKQPMILNSVERTIQRKPSADYQVLHADETSSDDPQWMALVCTSEVRRPTMRPPQNSRSPFKLAKPVAVQEESSASEESLVAPSPLTPKLLARLDELEISQRETLEAVRQISSLVQEIGLHVAAKESIRERERFVNEAEDRLVEEAHRLEVERAELEQLRAELNRGNLKVVGE